MTKSGAVSSLEKIDRILESLARNDALTPQQLLTLKRDADHERGKIRDIVSLIGKLDRTVRSHQQ